MRPNKSTTGRINTWLKRAHEAKQASGPALARSGISVLQRVAPDAAASMASRLFFRAPPRPRRRSKTALAEWSRPTVELGFGAQRIGAWVWGSGPTVLLVHGWGGLARQLRAFVAPLLEAGYRVVAFDAPGHGASSGDELSLPIFADSITRVAEVFGPVHAVVAHSFGGAATSLALARGVRAERAVLIGAPADAGQWFSHFSRLLALEPGTRERTRARIERRVGAPFGAFTAEALGPQVEQRVLVVHDREDREVPFQDGERTARALRNAELVATSGLGHRRILGDPTVVEQVRAFLGEAPTAAARGTRCDRCGASLALAWLPHDDLCSGCGLATLLSTPEARWVA